jgi:hypothetical protein
MSKALPFVLALFACSSKKSSEPDPGSAGSQQPPPAVDAAAGPAGSAAAEQRTVIKDVGFATPESVLYDADADVYLVSNINGKPADVDDNGFISRVAPDGKVIELKWIDGAKPDVKLDAPKGSAISGGVLWVADITVVRKFDAKTGKQLGDVKIDGATFLNDVAPHRDGGIYVTDTGVDASFKPSGTDAVYLVDKDGKVDTVAKAAGLEGPNGVIAVDGTVHVVTFRSNKLLTIADEGTVTPSTLPKGQLDGIVAVGKTDLVISSWEAKTVYRGYGDRWTDLTLDLEAPADIGWDSKRKRLLIPQFNANAVVVLGM